MSSSYGVQSHSQFFTILLAGFTLLKELPNLEINAFKSFVEPKKNWLFMVVEDLNTA